MRGLFRYSDVCRTSLIVRKRSIWSWSKPPAVKFDIIQPSEEETPSDLDLVPSEICRPAYATKRPNGKSANDKIPLKSVVWSPEEIEKIRKACRLAKKTLEFSRTLVKPGTSTWDIDKQVREFLFDHGAYPSPLNFKGFPKSISCSVNNVAAHGIPDTRELKEGDILNIDVTTYLDGFHGDCSDTFCVGKVDPFAKKLIRVTHDCLDIGIQNCGPNKLFRLIGLKIHKLARSEDCTTIPLFLGHGIGSFFHGPPDIYHCPNNYPGRMQPGMVFTIEPCISEGDRRVKILSDGWTAVTQDNSRTAQAEHTILITDTGVEILTA